MIDRRKTKIGPLSLALLLSLSLGRAVPPSPAADRIPTARYEMRGIWIHIYGPFDWEAAMSRIAAAGFNSVFVRVARGVNAIYPSQYLPRDPWAEAAGGDELARAIEAAHRHGLRFHAWKVCFNASAALKAGGGPAAMYHDMERQDRLARDPHGKQAAFLNPGDPRNADLELNVLTEIATKYQVDGIHLDYIRYTEVPSYDFDYGEVSRRRFEVSLGQTVPHWPEDVYSGSLKLPYEDWERNNINELVYRVHGRLQQARPLVKLSAAVWHDHHQVRASLKQDWLLWVRKRVMDFVVPMDYLRTDGEFRAALQSQIPNTTEHLPLVAGIASYLLDGPSVLRQIQIAREEGAAGYVLFDYKADMRLLFDELAKTPPALPVDLQPVLKWILPLHQPVKDQLAPYGTGSVVHLKASSGLRGWPLALEPMPPGKGPAIIYRPTKPRSDEFALRLPRLEGRWRLSAWPEPGTAVPFVSVAGPMIETLSPEKLRTLAQRDMPPRPRPVGLRVAIFADGSAASGLFAVLSNQPAVHPYLIHHLQPEFWRNADVLILPRLKDLADISDTTVAQLRNWVRGSGRLILTHDAVGYRWHPRMFPEVAVGIAGAKEREIEVLPLAGLSAGILTHAYPNHVLLQPAPGATVLAREVVAPGATGRAVIVTGRFGKGRVTMIGALPGYAREGAMPEAEKQLLLQLVELK